MNNLILVSGKSIGVLLPSLSPLQLSLKVFLVFIRDRRLWHNLARLALYPVE